MREPEAVVLFRCDHARCNEAAACMPNEPRPRGWHTLNLAINNGKSSRGDFCCAQHAIEWVSATLVPDPNVFIDDTENE